MTTRLGPLLLQFSGSSPIRELIETELTRPNHGEASLRSLEIAISHAVPPVVEGPVITGSRLNLRHSVGELDTGGLRLSMGVKRSVTLYTVDLEGDLLGPDPVRATIYLPAHLEAWSRYTGPIARVMSRDSSTLLQVAAKNVIYEIIDTLASYRLLGIDASILHSAAISHDGRAVAITGTGGVGKSTSLLAAMDQHTDLSYLSDDMLIVDSEAHLYRHPKKIQVYEYNLSRLPNTRSAVMDSMTANRQRLWNSRVRALGPKQARIRMSAEELFGKDRVDDHGVLSAVMWVRSVSVGEPGVHRTDGVDLAQRAATALVDELWDFGRLLNLGSLLSNDVPSTAEFHNRAVSVLSNAFNEIPCYELTVPYGADPTQLVGSLRSVMEW